LVKKARLQIPQHFTFEDFQQVSRLKAQTRDSEKMAENPYWGPIRFWFFSLDYGIN